jgi:hypothetical protein
MTTPKPHEANIPFYPMFLLLLGGSLTFGAGFLAAAIYTDGALVAMRTAAEVIGWLCSGLAVLSMSYFFEWNELPRAAIRHAAAETFHVRALPVAYKVIEPELVEPVMRRAELPEVAKVSQPPRKAAVASLRPVVLAVNACSTVSGVESLQCDRCSDRLGLSWVACQESVRLAYCQTEAGDERTCPSPIPQSHPG